MNRSYSGKMEKTVANGTEVLHVSNLILYNEKLTEIG